MDEPAGTVPRYATVTVTFNPDMSLLRCQLAELAGAAAIVVVDNASGASVTAELRRLVEAHSQTMLVAHDRNCGLAAGLNAGASAALGLVPHCEYLLFLDQDTLPGAAGANRLVQAAQQLRRLDPRTGLVGPLMVDVATGLSHGVHVIKGWRWTRVFPKAAETAVVRCASVNGSGMVVPAEVWRAQGGFDESLFIDHIDSEWSFRLAGADYHLYTTPTVRFAHRMGARSIRLWLGGWRVWPYRAPLRHYYLFRNTVLLMRKPYTPLVWKFWAVAKLALTALMHAVADSARKQQVSAMVAGVRAGMRGHSGEYRTDASKAA